MSPKNLNLLDIVIWIWVVPKQQCERAWAAQPHLASELELDGGGGELNFLIDLMFSESRVEISTENITSFSMISKWTFYWLALCFLLYVNLYDTLKQNRK